MGISTSQQKKESKNNLLPDKGESTTNQVGNEATTYSSGFPVLRVSVIFIVVFITTGLILILYFVYTPEKLPEFCTKCDDLSSETLRNFPGCRRKRPNGEELCCVDSKDQYKTLMKQLLNQSKPRSGLIQQILDKREKKLWEAKEATITLLHDSPVAAHVLVGSKNSSYFPLPTEIKDMPASKVLKTYPNRSLTLLKNVRLYQDRLIIPSDGTYRLYSQIYFKIIQDRNWPYGFRLLCHLVQRFNRRLPNHGKQTLLQSVYTVPRKAKYPDVFDFHTSYVSGVVELMKGDEVYVRASEADVVARPTLNYLGLVKLGENKM